MCENISLSFLTLDFGQPVQKSVYLLDATSAVERGILRDWLAKRSETSAPMTIPVPPSRGRSRRKTRLDPRLDLLATAAVAEDDPLLQPVRVAWLPREIGGTRQARFYDLFVGDPRDPNRFRQRWLHRMHPERCVVVEAEPARASVLKNRWEKQADGAPFGEFVARQAWLALERAERALRGARYKVPRFIHEEILARADFRAGLAVLAAETGKSEAAVRAVAGAYLKEIAANHSPFVIDLVHRTIGWAYRQGYAAVHYSAERLRAIYADAQRYPLVFLPTHKSNLDHLLMQYLLHENNFPPNHTAGGINMNFFPIGPLFRRTGVFFIRRTFKDNPVYKFVMRQYIDYLVEKRFPLEWYMEGGRSRTGKLLPPRLGMLAYVVDAWRRGKSEDVILVPVSIAYDQISDVGSYVSEQRGAKKEAESFGWKMQFLRNLRRQYGSIHVTFGETVSLAKALGAPGGGTKAGDAPDERNLAVQKLAFDVAVRVNRVTPITAPALVALVFLGEDDKAMTTAEILAVLSDIVAYVRRRGLPTTGQLGLDTAAGVERALDRLVENGLFVRYSEGQELLFGIAPGQHLASAYYRNTVVHFFVNAAIAELALLAAVDEPEQALVAFWSESMRLRDLLKFEFFFSEKEAFKAEIRAEVALHEPEWEKLLALPNAEALEILRKFRPFMAHRALRPFLEATTIVGDALVRLGSGPYKEADFLAQTLALGRQYLLQKRVQRAESVSKTLFATAAQAAAHQQLTDATGKDVAGRRAAFAAEMHLLLRRIDAIDVLQAARRVGVFG